MNRRQLSQLRGLGTPSILSSEAVYVFGSCITLAGGSWGFSVALRSSIVYMDVLGVSGLSINPRRPLTWNESKQRHHALLACGAHSDHSSSYRTLHKDQAQQRISGPAVVIALSPRATIHDACRAICLVSEQPYHLAQPRSRIMVQGLASSLVCSAESRRRR